MSDYDDGYGYIGPPTVMERVICVSLAVFMYGLGIYMAYIGPN